MLKVKNGRSEQTGPREGVSRGVLQKKGFVLAVLLGAGVASLAAAFAIGWAGWFDGHREDRVFLVWASVAGLVLSIAVMVAWGIRVGGRLKWVAVSMAAVLILGFSVLAIWSVGFLIAPIGLGLLAISVLRLATYSSDRQQDKAIESTRRPGRTAAPTGGERE